MKNIIYMILLFLVIGVFSGCTQNQVDLNPRISDPHIVVENPSIYNWLKLERVNYFKRKDGLLVVEAKFQNLSNFNEKIAYKINWIDTNGFTQKSILSRWVVSDLEQRRGFIVHGIAPSMKVKEFEIRLQKPTSDDKNRKDSYHSEYQN